MGEESDNTVKSILYSTDQFDKSIIFIASGALGISFAFIKDIIPNLNASVFKNYLITSWYIFSGVIFLATVCHFISMLANTWAQKNRKLDAEIFNSKILYWNWPIRIINFAMIIGLLIGSLYLICFIKMNI